MKRLILVIAVVLLILNKSSMGQNLHDLIKEGITQAKVDFNQQYYDSMVISYIDFQAFELFPEQRNDLKKCNVYYKNNKVSKIFYKGDSNNSFDYNIWLKETESDLIYGLVNPINNSSRELSTWLLEGFLIFDINNEVPYFICFPQLFQNFVIRTHINKEDTLTDLRYQASPNVTVDNVIIIWRLDDKLNPIFRINIRKSQIETVSDVYEENGVYKETLYVYRNCQNFFRSVDLYKLSILTKLRYSSTGFMKCTVMPEQRKGVPLWFDSVSYE